MRPGASATSAPSATEQDDAVVVEQDEPDTEAPTDLEVVQESDLTVENSDDVEDDEPAEDVEPADEAGSGEAEADADDGAGARAEERAEDDQPEAETPDAATEVDAGDEADDSTADKAADKAADATAEDKAEDARAEEPKKPERPGFLNRPVRNDDTQPLALPPPMPVPGQGRPAPATPGAPMTAPIVVRAATPPATETNGKPATETTARPGTEKPARQDDGWDDDYLASGTSPRPVRPAPRTSEPGDDWDVEQWARGAWTEPGLPKDDAAEAGQVPSWSPRWDGAPVASPQIVAPKGRRRLALAGAAVMVVAVVAAVVLGASARSRPAARTAADQLQQAETAAGAVLAADVPLKLKSVQADLTTLITLNDRAGRGDHGLAWTVARWTTSPRRLGAVNRKAEAMAPVADTGRLLSLSLARAYDGHTDPARLQQLAADLAAFAQAADDAGIGTGSGTSNGTSNGTSGDSTRRMAVAAGALQAIAADRDTQRWAVCPTSPRQCQRFEVKQGKIVQGGSQKGQNGLPRSGDIQVLGKPDDDLRASGYLSTPALVDLLMRSADGGDKRRPVVQRVSTLAPPE